MASPAKYDELPTAEPAIPLPVATPMVEVTAPASLNAGFTFDASVGGKVFKVEVPAGGVKQGQRFSVPVPAEADCLSKSDSFADDAPRYQWKDGLCDCFKYGCCHPSFLHALCCPQLLMAQIATRMKLDWLGRAVGPASAEHRNTFCKVATIVAAYFILSAVFAPFQPSYTVDDEGNIVAEDGSEAHLYIHLTNQIVALSFGIYSLVVMMKIRRTIREHYHIKTNTCGACEDCCCVFWCGCCTVAQMARHTANYDDRQAECCSETGLCQATVSSAKAAMIV